MYYRYIMEFSNTNLLQILHVVLKEDQFQAQGVPLELGNFTFVASNRSQIGACSYSEIRLRDFSSKARLNFIQEIMSNYNSGNDILFANRKKGTKKAKVMRFNSTAPTTTPTKESITKTIDSEEKKLLHIGDDEEIELVEGTSSKEELLKFLTEMQKVNQTAEDEPVEKQIDEPSKGGISDNSQSSKQIIVEKGVVEGKQSQVQSEGSSAQDVLSVELKDEVDGIREYDKKKAQKKKHDEKKQEIERTLLKKRIISEEDMNERIEADIEDGDDARRMGTES